MTDLTEPLSASIAIVRDRDLYKSQRDELLESSNRLSELLEAWDRSGEDCVPERLRGTTREQVLDAMFDMRAVIARISP